MEQRTKKSGTEGVVYIVYDIFTSVLLDEYIIVIPLFFFFFFFGYVKGYQYLCSSQFMHKCSSTKMSVKKQNVNVIQTFMAYLEVQRGRRVEGVKRRRVVERRVKGNDSPSPCLDVFKISKGEQSNQSFPLFGCFKNQDGNERK